MGEKITLERLARMVQAGFAEIQENLHKTVTREEFRRATTDLSQEVADVQEGLVNVRSDLANLSETMEGIADEVLDNHRVRIGKLEDMIGHD